ATIFKRLLASQRMVRMHRYRKYRKAPTLIQVDILQFGLASKFQKCQEAKASKNRKLSESERDRSHPEAKNFNRT
ncbi:hypothetical protein J6590_102431, partial [Homalodisca vitripennis]